MIESTIEAFRETARQALKHSENLVLDNAPLEEQEDAQKRNMYRVKILDESENWLKVDKKPCSAGGVTLVAWSNVVALNEIGARGCSSGGGYFGYWLRTREPI